MPREYALRIFLYLACFSVAELEPKAMPVRPGQAEQFTLVTAGAFRYK